MPMVELVNERKRPIWLPDTQGFLAVAILIMVGGIVYILLTDTPKFDDKAAGAFMTVLGVLLACLKDVYAFFFGSSKQAEKSGDVVSAIAASPTPPSTPAPLTTDQLGEQMLKNGQLAYFRNLPTEDAKKNFLAMSDEQRAAVIAQQ